VSAVTLRLPNKISLMRCGGTESARAKAFCESASGFKNSSRRISSTVGMGSKSAFLVVVDDFNVFSMSTFPCKANAPQLTVSSTIHKSAKTHSSAFFAGQSHMASKGPHQPFRQLLQRRSDSLNDLPQCAQNLRKWSISHSESFPLWGRCRAYARQMRSLWRPYAIALPLWGAVKWRVHAVA
jgi:hypothetical protein